MNKAILIDKSDFRHGSCEAAAMIGILKDNLFIKIANTIMAHFDAEYMTAFYIHKKSLLLYFYSCTNQSVHI